MAASGYNMLTSSPEACLAGPFVLAWLCYHGHHQCLRQGFVPHVARLATRTSFTSHGAMLLMRFALVPFCGKACNKKQVSATVCAICRATFRLRMLAGSSPSCFHVLVCSFTAHDAEQESGTVAPCILVDAEPQTYNCNLVIGTKQRKCNFVLDNS